MRLLTLPLVLISFLISSPVSARPQSKTSPIAAANVMSFGARADGKTDDTLAFQKAIDFAGTKGGVVLAPAGTYLIPGSLDLPQGVTLRGVWEAPHLSIVKGTVILATGGEGDENAKPLISMSANSCVKGLTIIYPNQKADRIVPFPWTIAGREMHCSVIDVTLTNPYKAITFPTWNEVHFVSNVYGCPLKEGIFVDNCTDIGRIENVHFSPNYWTRAGAPYAVPRNDHDKLGRFMAENLVAYRFGRTDWEYMTNCFCIGAKIGYHFVKTAKGGPNVVLTQCGSDGGSTAVQVDNCQPHAGIAFSNSQFEARVVTTNTNNGPVKFSNCGFWPVGDTDNQALLEGHGTVTFTACHFLEWGKKNPNAACIVAKHGTLIVSGCDFMAAKPQIELGEGVGNAAIFGNLLRGGQKILNNSKGSVQIGLNVGQ
ncbi:MAG: glycosyl hydrolase family 28-related protein [Armatimonadota bacterium]|nr:glycosyl hydrolase family 28-related protein [Armatimonadota bacterium]